MLQPWQKLAKDSNQKLGKCRFKSASKFYDPKTRFEFVDTTFAADQLSGEMSVTQLETEWLN